jgi:YfiR/HmsC-like
MSLERSKPLPLASIFCGVWLTLFLNGGAAQAESASEYEVKATYLYQFASFIEWPPAPHNTAICIGILGTDQFGKAIDRIVQGKLAGNRGFVVERFHSAEEATYCDILFISSSEQMKLREILGVLRGKPVLTVSEVPGFCEQGGAINLRVVSSAIRLEINPAAGARSGLRFSSKLLSLAKVVTEVSP